jgi:hypothetical protein
MIKSRTELQVTMEQMGRVIRAIRGVKRELLGKNPRLFRTLVEGYLEELDRLRAEINGYLKKRKRAG